MEDIEEYCNSLEERVNPIVKRFLEDSYKQGYNAGQEEGYGEGYASVLDEFSGKDNEEV